jgi:hypothetical protein
MAIDGRLMFRCIAEASANGAISNPGHTEQRFMGEIVGLASGHQAYKNALRVVEAQTADLRRQLTRLRKTLREHGGSTRRLAPRGCKKRRR